VIPLMALLKETILTSWCSLAQLVVFSRFIPSIRVYGVQVHNTHVLALLGPRFVRVDRNAQ